MQLDTVVPEICTESRSRKYCTVGTIRVGSMATAATANGAIGLSAGHVSYHRSQW